MEPFILGVGSDFAKGVASGVLHKGADLLKGYVFGDAETNLLAEVLKAAVADATSDVEFQFAADEESLRDEIASNLQIVLSNEETLTALANATLAGVGDPQKLTELAIRAGVDPRTLPFSWTAFLQKLLASFEIHLRDAAGRTGSPLRDRVALSQLFQLRGILTRHVETVERFVDRLADGLSEVDPEILVGQFVKEYLGTTTRPKPFGGRHHEIDLLNDWFCDPDARPALMLVAPAGRGKSALLVHWLRQIPSDVAVVFMPISLRYQTAQPGLFLPALAIRLARAHGLTLDAVTLRDTLACRSIIANLMQRPTSDGRRLLVVVDGLDEAGNGIKWPGLLPLDLPTNARMVVSARPLAGDTGGEDWMARTAWDSFPERVRSFELPGLTGDDVREVLKAMSLDLSAETAREIHRLADGDPLLTGLYAEHLWQQQTINRGDIWTAARLREFEPGLRQFFQRWLSDQQALVDDSSQFQETRLRALLAVFSHALGPLAADELREIVRRAYAEELGSLRLALMPLSRFIVGNGREQGFTLAHPRLNEFFASEDFMGSSDSRRVQAAYLDWGRETARALVGTDSDKAVPRYLLHHLADHFTRTASRAPDYVLLIQQGWARAWRIEDPTGRGFLADVQRTWEAVEAETFARVADGETVDLAPAIRCLLWMSTIQAPAQLPPPELFAAAIEAGELSATQALAVLAFTLGRPGFETSVEALAPVIAPHAGLAMADLADIPPPSLSKVRALVAVAREMPDADRIRVVDRAIRTAKDLDDGFESLCARIVLLPFLSAGRRSQEQARISEALTEYPGRRYGADLLARLPSELHGVAAPLAYDEIKRYFVLSGFAPEPAAAALFRILPSSEKQAFIEGALSRSADEDVKNHGAFLAVIAPTMDSEQRLRAIGRIAELDPAGQVTLLSQFIDATLARLLPDLDILVLRAIAESVHLDTLANANWINLLRSIDDTARTTISRAALNAIEGAVGSSRWMDIAAQLAPFCPSEERRRLARVTLNQGRQHFDEAAVLESLGKALPLLPAQVQISTQAKLAARIGRYLAQRSAIDDPRRTLLALPLLEFMEPTVASAFSAAVFERFRDGRTPTIEALSAIVPFLPVAAKPAAIEMLSALVRSLGWTTVGPSLLLRSQAWISPSLFQETVVRMIAAAEADAPDNPRLQAFNLAHLLKIIPAEKTDALSLRLFTLADAADEWDESWVYALLSIVSVRSEHWLVANLLPRIMNGRFSRGDMLPQLLVAVSERCQSPQREMLAQEALNGRPLKDWPTERVAYLLTLIDRDDRVVLLSQLIRSLSNERRIRQISAIDDLLDTIAKASSREDVDAIWEAIWDITLWWP